MSGKLSLAARLPPLRQDPIGVAVTAVDVTAEFEPDPELSKLLDGYSSAVDGKMEEVVIFIIVIFLIIIFIVVIVLVIIILIIIFLPSYSPVE